MLERRALRVGDGEDARPQKIEDGADAAVVEKPEAADLIALTYFDHRKSLPLPLWYARQGVEVVKKPGLLEFYKRETLRAMREEQVDQAWLAGWEEES